MNAVEILVSGDPNLAGVGWGLPLKVLRARACACVCFSTVANNQLMPCEKKQKNIWDEREQSLDGKRGKGEEGAGEKRSSRLLTEGVKVLSQTLELYFWSCQLPLKWLTPPRPHAAQLSDCWRLFLTVPLNEIFPHHSLFLPLPTVPVSPSWRAEEGGSSDYLRCGLIAFPNLCTHELQHRPWARRTCPDGPLLAKKNKQAPPTANKSNRL